MNGKPGHESAAVAFSAKYLDALAFSQGAAVRYTDAKCTGLMIECGKKTKTWKCRYTLAGARKILGGHRYPACSLAEARRWATAVVAKASLGEDPEGEKAGEGKTFEEVAREWYTTKASRAVRTRRGILQRLEAHLFPSFGKKPILALERKEIAAHFKALEQPKAPRGTQGPRGGGEVARRTLSIFSEVMRYAANHGYVEDARAVPDRTMFAPRRAEHHEAVEVADLPRFLEAFARNEANARFPTRIALALQVLLFQRPGETVGMLVSELDLENGLWNIEGRRMKRKQEVPHTVPLPACAVALLKSALPYARNGFVFAGHGPKEPVLTTASILRALRRLGFERETCHGFRALARTTLVQEPFNVAAAVLEAQLAHAKENQVQAAYDRATFLAERRIALEQWAGHLESLRPGWLPVAVAWA